MTSIVLVDDHNVVRQGLRALLEAEDDFEVVGEAGDGLTAVALIEQFEPDILVLDLKLPSLSGVEVAKKGVVISPKTAVVILSMYSDDRHVIESLCAGARGYVLKDASATELVFAVREALAGHRYLSPPLYDRAIEAYVMSAPALEAEAYDSLTPREREVLELTAKGLTSPDIAGVLTISARTAEAHRANLMRKLGLRNKADLVRFAVTTGVLSEDE